MITEDISLLGKSGLFSNPPKTTSLKYLSGIKKFDTILELNNATDFGKVYITNVIRRPLGFEISVMNKFKLHKIGLLFSDIIATTIEKPAMIIVNKEKSVIGRAALGGLIFGPLGAIIGGLSGIGTISEKIALQDTLISFKLKDDSLIIFGADANKDKNIDKELKILFDGL